MTIEAFVNKYNGKYLEQDGAYWFQCVEVRQCVDLTL